MSTCYKFGGVEVRPAERQIVVEGQPASVGARAFDVLMALIDRRDRVVTKDELLDIVWPGLVVEENNLQVQVSTLRKVMGARSVATIPGRGYRFTLEPESLEPSSRAISAPRHNLPSQLNRFIGREREIGEVKSLLASSRLVTLASLGGTGKTRLSLQVGQELTQQFADGVWFVELAAVSDEGRLVQAVAGVLGVHEEPGNTLLQAVCARLRERNLLLVLDNCEHVLKAAAEVAKQLLRAAASLRILASSREPLHVTGETVYPLSPLPTPDSRYPMSSEILEQYDAVRLFVDRAMAASGNFRLTDSNVRFVATICERLDGIPLAIELAAARVRALSVENIATRLDDCFRLLTGGDQTAAPRQQTLRASLDWSYDLLTSEEAVLLRRVSIFAGGWTLEAAERVTAGGAVSRHDVLDLLTRLVEKSLVDIDAYGERYRLLETVRQYAAEKLRDSGELHDLRDRLLGYVLEFVTTARGKLGGPEEGDWLLRLDAELENVLAAHSWADGERGLLLVTCIKRYCVNRGLNGLAHRLACEALAQAPERSLARCHALFDAGQMGYGLGRYEQSRNYLEESISIARELGNDQRLALALQPLGAVCMSLGDLEAAGRHLELGLAMALQGGNEREIATALSALGQLHCMKGEMQTAAELYREAVAYGRRIGDRETVALFLLNLAMAATQSSLRERAEMVLEAIKLGEEVASRYVGRSALDVAAGLLAMAGTYRACARLYGAAQALSSRTGVQRDAVDEAFVAPLVQRARADLGGDFASEEAAGRALAYAEAVNDARDQLAELNQQSTSHPSL